MRAQLCMHALITAAFLSADRVLSLQSLRRRIHDPVPIFNQEILKPVNNFMNRITPNKPFWRANWTVRPLSHCSALGPDSPQGVADPGC